MHREKSRLFGLIGATGPSKSPNEGVTESGLLAAVKTTGKRDNSIPFSLLYFSAKDKTQHAGNAKNIPYQWKK